MGTFDISIHFRVQAVSEAQAKFFATQTLSRIGTPFEFLKVDLQPEKTKKSK